MDGPTAVFVYGTLKRGEVREKCWPKKPVAIEEASVRGALYALDEYPGLVEGEDVVVGEVWRFAAEDMQETLARLNQVEGFCGGADDEYRRVVIMCETVEGTVEAWTYLYARVSELRPDCRVKADANGVCRWSKIDALVIRNHK
jgi:gamma-glutamylcyclotransferase (GGCT)/AIG2-like uncharacterized protein YtfP